MRICNLTENLKKFKVGNTTYQRYKDNVGKPMRGKIYFHKQYWKDIVPVDVYKSAVSMLPKDFHFNTMMYDPKDPTKLRFDECSGFDTEREPVVGDMITVDVSDGTIKRGHTNQIFHHKWQWVRDDYTGFDITKAYEWSKLWTSKIQNPSGYINKWNDALDTANLPRDGMYK